MMRKYWKQSIAYVLVFAMLVGFFPTVAFATENDEEITCSPQTGLSSIYDYATYDIGIAGIAHVNKYSATLHIRRSDIYLGGERLPVDVEFYYDPVNFLDMSTEEVNPYGVGWLTAYHQTIEYDSVNEQFAYKNANGTMVYFQNSGTVENSLEIWNEVTTLGIGATGSVLYRTTDAGLSDNTAIDVVCDGIHHEFDSAGRLMRLSTGSNQTLIEYVEQSRYKIQKITDSVGRQFCFTYSSSGSSGVLTQILCKTAIGESITSNGIAICTSYTILDGLLASVSNNIGDSIAYTYDSANRICSAANIDGCGYNFGYADNSDQIAVINAKAAMGTEHEADGTVTTIAVSEAGTIMTCENLRNVFTFDSCGRLVSCELQSISITSDIKGSPAVEYTCLNGYRLLYETVNKDDGTVVNEITGIERYNADGVIEDDASLEENSSIASSNTQVTDSFGNTLSSTTTIGDQHQTTSYTYSSDGNYLTSVTDENGNTTQYTYDANSGNLLSLTDGNGNKTEYSYNAIRELENAHLDILGSFDDAPLDMDVDYTYNKGRLTQLIYGDYTYDFSYDIWGNILTVKMNGGLLVSYEYADNASTGMIETMTYGNGKTVYYGYDALGQVNSVSYDSEGNVRFQYSYDAEGNLSSISDLVTGQVTSYTDQGYSISTQDGSVLYSYASTSGAGNNQTIKGTTYYTSVSQTTTSTQETTTKRVIDQLGNSVALADTTLDGFGRLIKKNYTFGNTSVYQKYDYAEDTSGGTGSFAEGYHTGYDLNSTDKRFFDYTYEYDGNGNIVSISKIEKYTMFKQTIPDPSPITPPIEVASLEDGESAGTNVGVLPTLVTTTVSNTQTDYSYDEAGQLREVVDGETNRTYRYAYDSSGNIQTAQKYSVATSGTEALVDSKTYSYSNGLLTGYTNMDGTQVSYQYDAMGNPVRISSSTSIDYTALTWGEGRMLVGVSDGESNITYTYNADGLRIGKTVIGETVEETQYIWSPEGLVAVITDDHTIKVMYDASGEAIGFSVDGTPYTYVKNIQGDIIRILDSNKTSIVDYKYDPWGVPTVSGTTSIAKLNPCTYRGYYYDWDTGYYYLQSRYYDPNIGHFLNADDASYLQVNGSALQGNLFAYCMNDPINSVDPLGYLGKHWWNKVSSVAKIINVLLYAFGVYSTNKTLSQLRSLIKQQRDKIARGVWIRISAYISSLTLSRTKQAIDIALILIDLSIGLLIAKAFDYIDSWFGYTRNNGYIFN